MISIKGVLLLVLYHNSAHSLSLLSFLFK